MAYDTNIPASFPAQIATNWELEVQQTQSKLERCVTMAPHTGTMKQLKWGQQFSSKALAGRMERVTPVEFAGRTRWQIATKGTIDDPVAFDEWDEDDLAEVALPHSSVLQNYDAAYKRAIDAEIIASMSRAVYTGDRAPTASVDFPSSTNTIAHGSTGLTVAKIALVLRRMREANVDVDAVDIFGVISGYDDEYLINNVAEVRSIDYSKAQPIDGGTVIGKKWMGINWVHSSQLAKDTSAHTVDSLIFARNCILWNPGTRKIKPEIRTDLSGALQIRASWMFGATRAEDSGVFVVKNNYATIA